MDVCGVSFCFSHSLSTIVDISTIWWYWCKFQQEILILCWGFSNPSQENPSQENPSQENPSQENPSQENPSQENPSQENPSQENPSQENPSQEKPPLNEKILNEKNELVHGICFLLGKTFSVRTIW